MNAAADGSQTVVITASASGYTGGTGNLTVTDNDVPLVTVINEVLADPTRMQTATESSIPRTMNSLSW